MANCPANRRSIMNQQESRTARKTCISVIIACIVVGLLTILVYSIAHGAFCSGRIRAAFFPLRKVCVAVTMAACVVLAIAVVLLIFLLPLPKKYRVASVIGRILFTVVFGGAIALLMFFLYMWMNGALL